MILIVFAVIFAGLLTWFWDTDFLAIIAPLWMFSLVLLSITTSFVLIPVLVMFSFLCGLLFKMLFSEFVLYPAHMRKKWETVKDVIHYTLPKWYSPMEIALIYNWNEHADIVPIALYYWSSKWYLEMLEDEQFFWASGIFWIKMKSIKFRRFIEKSDFKEFVNKKGAFRLDLEEELRNKIVMNFKEEIDEAHIKRREKKLDIRDIMFRMDRSLKAKITPNYKKRYENRYTNKCPMVLLFIWIILVFNYPYYGIVLMMLSVLFMVSFRHYMMIRERNKNIREEDYLSDEWRTILEQVHWFRKYLMQVDDARLESLTQEDPDYYEKILPYAIALWVGDEWVRKYTSFSDKYWIELFGV